MQVWSAPENSFSFNPGFSTTNLTQMIWKRLQTWKSTANSWPATIIAHLVTCFASPQRSSIKGIMCRAHQSSGKNRYLFMYQFEFTWREKIFSYFFILSDLKLIRMRAQKTVPGRRQDEKCNWIPAQNIIHVWSEIDCETRKADSMRNYRRRGWNTAALNENL